MRFSATTRLSSYWILLTNILSLNWIHHSSCAISGFNESPTQYHIQTDEGPERFFRFQTYNGQYRRERRLDDGTVVGSYGWVDPAGFLRMTDYVADSKGFRVVKTRMEYVGVKPVPEEEEEVTKVYTPMKHSVKVTAPYEFPFSTALPSQNALQDDGPRKREFTLRQDPVSPRPTISNNNDLLQPESSIQPPPSTKRLRQVTVPFNDDDENRPFKRPVKSRIIRVYRRPVANKFSSTFESETISDNDEVRFARFRPAAPANSIFGNSNGTTEQVDVFKNYVNPLPRGQGFIYRIPNQYHKEETSPDGTRSGSFGYVDPYGIRRVIHYNAGKDGFEHERDFKYVGKQY